MAPTLNIDLQPAKNIEEKKMYFFVKLSCCKKNVKTGNKHTVNVSSQFLKSEKY